MARKVNTVADALSRKSLFVLRVMNTQLSLFDDGSILAELKTKPVFLQQICEAQKCDTKLQECNMSRLGILTIRSGLMINLSTKNFELIQKKLYEAHSGCLSVHSGSTKHVKAKHQVPLGLLQPVMIPELKRDRVTMDFISGLPLSPKKKDDI
ncbi:integrase [Gossypium australe]|uniref:Integrase n=1 Tax=Gossypium australe TaxID=47621 RepID=A0A5B6VBD0_9ROSI|nr:integrase [Gossypium australe]